MTLSGAQRALPLIRAHPLTASSSNIRSPVCPSSASETPVIAAWTSEPATAYFTLAVGECIDQDHCALTGTMLAAIPIASAIIGTECPLTLPTAAVAPKIVLAYTCTGG